MRAVEEPQGAVAVVSFHGLKPITVNATHNRQSTRSLLSETKDTHRPSLVADMALYNTLLSQTRFSHQQYARLTRSYTPPNHKSALDNPSVIREYLAEEVSIIGRMSGPLTASQVEAELGGFFILVLLRKPALREILVLSATYPTETKTMGTRSMTTSTQMTSPRNGVPLHK
ncbi:uncharacterized protein HD556DRAFT_1437636 [Suillus plorans]|uniref:Uncharacterized protein n=1 Tax=Suillus plorans TaxID=116603 RepID=A0A9P7J5D7_9AGAM|nr:uncharacterized protein HD556DRAFT_1437636 [Suillus plorans]KAG1803901.1 hypothetical protein HD556DRAFT_1437636 [Suillus plorans]